MFDPLIGLRFVLLLWLLVVPMNMIEDWRRNRETPLWVVAITIVVGALFALSKGWLN